MLSVHCERIGGRALVFSGDVSGIENTPAGMTVRYRCACGQPGVLLTGRGTPARSGHARVGAFA